MHKYCAKTTNVFNFFLKVCVYFETMNVFVVYTTGL